MMAFRSLAAMAMAAWLLAAGPVGAQDAAAADNADGAAAPETADTAPDFSGETRVPLLLDTGLKAYAEKDYETMAAAISRAAYLRPHLADLKFLEARAFALLDRKTDAYNALVLLQKQGLSFKMDGDADFENLRGFQLYDYLREQFDQNAAPFGQNVRWATVDGTDLLLESLAWDGKAERLLAGSGRDGSVYVVAQDGNLEALAKPDATNGLLGITSLAVDADRGALWVASAGTPQASFAADEDRGKTRLHRFEAATGKHVATYEAPVRGMLFIDLALAPNGDVYLADASRPVIWKLAAEGEEAGELVPFFAGRGLTSVRTIEVESTGRFLYLADYERGLFGVSLADQDLFSIHLGDAMNLGGVDAIHWQGDSLIVVQNGVWPRRVLRLGLFPDRRRAQHVQSLESNHPEFRNPVAGTVAGPTRFLLIANSHRGAYDPRTGQPLPDVERKPNLILAIDPTLNWNPPGLDLGPIRDDS